MSLFSRLRARFRRSKGEKESHRILKTQLKEFHQSNGLSPSQHPYECLRFACSKNYVLLISHVLGSIGWGGVVDQQNDPGKSPLRTAVELGHNEAVVALLESREITEFHSFPMTLKDCVLGANLEMLRTLLFTSLGESRLLQPGNGAASTLLIEAAFRAAMGAKNYDSATVLLDAQFPASDGMVRNMHSSGPGATFLSNAFLDLLLDDSKSSAPKHWRDLAKLLIQKGADVNAIAMNGSSILHTLCSQGLHNEVVFLLNQNADANQKSRLGATPLFDVVSRLCKYFEEGRRGKGPAMPEDHRLVRTLLDHGANPEIQNTDGDTSLHPAVRSRNYGLLQILLNEAQNLTSVNGRGETLFSIAIGNNDFQCMELLTEKDMGLLNTANAEKKTALISAAQARRGQVVQWLVDAGALTDLADNEGNTALHYAAEHNDTAVLDMLLNAGASCAIRNNIDWYPVHCAAKAGSLPTYRRLLKADASIIHGEYLLGLFVLTLGPETGNIDMLRDVLRFKPDIHHVFDDSGATVVHICIDRGMSEQLKLLLESGANPNLKLNSGLALLDLALAKSDWELAQLLVAKGADPNYSGVSGALPINIACIKGQAELVRQMIGKGASITTLSRDNPPALFCAIYGGSLEIVRLLLNRGASPETFGSSIKETPLEVARRLTCADIQRELENRIANLPTNQKGSLGFPDRTKPAADAVKAPGFAMPPRSQPPSVARVSAATQSRSSAGSHLSNLGGFEPEAEGARPRIVMSTAAPDYLPGSGSVQVNNIDGELQLAALEEVFALTAQLASMLENPQATLHNLRTSSAAQLRRQSREEIELFNHFICEVDPWDREQLLDKLNGDGLRMLLDVGF